MTSKVTDIKMGLFTAKGERGKEFREHMLAAMELSTLTTPPDERATHLTDEERKDSMTRFMYDLDTPMGTPEQIAAAQRRWIETMPVHERVEYLSRQIALFPEDERETTYQEIMEKIPDLGPGMIDRIEQIRHSLSA